MGRPKKNHNQRPVGYERDACGNLRCFHRGLRALADDDRRSEINATRAGLILLLGPNRPGWFWRLFSSRWSRARH